MASLKVTEDYFMPMSVGNQKDTTTTTLAQNRLWIMASKICQRFSWLIDFTACQPSLGYFKAKLNVTPTYFIPIPGQRRLGSNSNKKATSHSPEFGWPFDSLILRHLNHFWVILCWSLFKSYGIHLYTVNKIDLQSFWTFHCLKEIYLFHRWDFKRYKHSETEWTWM